MSDVINLSVFTSTYDTKEAAENDYEAVKALYYDLDVMDTFDAAILEMTEKGKVKIIKKHEQPTRQAGWAGAGLGLATGLVVSLFPAVALTGVLAAEATAAGAAMGAMIGHVAGGMSRSDLKDLGEILDDGSYGLLVIAETDVSDRVKSAISGATDLVEKDLKADKKDLDKQIKKAINS
jgi:uncharacterized membrane protein